MSTLGKPSLKTITKKFPKGQDNSEFEDVPIPESNSNYDSILGWVALWVKITFLRNVWTKTIMSQKQFCVKENFHSKKVQKRFLGRKNMSTKLFWVYKNGRSKTILPKFLGL